MHYSRDSHHPLPQELHSFAFKNPDYRYNTGCKNETVGEIPTDSLIFQGKGCSSQMPETQVFHWRRLHLPHPPFPAETILPLEIEGFLLLMHRWEKISFTFCSTGSVKLREIGSHLHLHGKKMGLKYRGYKAASWVCAHTVKQRLMDKNQTGYY